MRGLLPCLLPCLLPVLWLYTVTGVNPDPPRQGGGVIGAKGLATAADCSGAVGFSALGTAKVHQTGLVSYRDTQFDRGVGFSRETGEFTVHCPGTYHIAFAAYSDQPNTKIVLKRRSSNSSWSDVLSAGSASSGGGSNQVLLELGLGDQTGVWLTGGSVTSTEEQRVPSTSFTAFRIAKK